MTTTTKCQHARTTNGPHRCYTGSVAHYPYTDENPAAHGCITYTETCDDCGAQRQWNANGCHDEKGTWGESARERAAREKRELAARVQAQHQAHPILARTRTYVHPTPIDSIGTIRIERDGRPMEVWRLDCEAAAAQEETGDGLPQFYAAVLAAAAGK